MKAVMISIRPKWCELIASGTKTIEVRKTRPKLETPFKCYIYETQGASDTPIADEDGHLFFKGRGLVIGEFACGDIEHIEEHRVINMTALEEFARLTLDELLDYVGDSAFFAWHVDDLVIYDKPRELSEFGLKERRRAGAMWNRRATMADSDRLRELICAIDVMLHGKQYRFEQEDGSWYSRASGKYMSIDDMLREIYEELSEMEG